MAVTEKKTAIIITFLGVLSFMFGIIAENKKPALGTPIVGKNVVVCKYGSDHTVFFGYLSLGFLAASSFIGFVSLFYPYKGKCILGGALFRSFNFVLFFNIALFTTGVALALLLWPTLIERHHILNNVHRNLKADCPTAKTGLLGGGAFVSLDASLFWLVALMMADNAREDYFEEVENDAKGEYDQITTADQPDTNASDPKEITV